MEACGVPMYKYTPHLNINAAEFVAMRRTTEASPSQLAAKALRQHEALRLQVNNCHRDGLRDAPNDFVVRMLLVRAKVAYRGDSRNDPLSRARAGRCRPYLGRVQ